MTTRPAADSHFTGAQVLELIATGAPLADSLDALCRLIDEQSGLMSAIHVLDTDSKRLSRIAGPHLPEAFRRATDLVPATPSELEASFDQMRALTGRLMRAQDDERRRIAQMLHETTAQDLAALKMHLARLDRTSTRLSDVDRAVLEESITLADQSMTGIRTLSYLLHPPFLDEAGLLSALRWYATGFAERSGIKIELDLPSTFERLPQDVETTLFRVVQEALINIHRHAGSQIAYVRLNKDVDRLVLEIEDRGCGLAEGLGARSMTGGQGVGVGVGIAGMRERLKQLGGTLEIESSRRGTIVRALVSLESDTS